MYCETGFIYTVQPNDTLWEIAQRYGTTTDAILFSNPLLKQRPLKTGQIIKIYPLERYTYPSTISRRLLGIFITFQGFWQQQQSWTKELIRSILGEVKDEIEIKNRLFKTASDLADVLRRLYGEDIGSQFGTLMSYSVKLETEVIKALMKDNTPFLITVVNKWKNNATEMAKYLNKINPHLPFLELNNALNERINHIKELCEKYFRKEYSQTITVQDKLEKNSQSLTDLMTLGISKHLNIY